MPNGDLIENLDPFEGDTLCVSDQRLQVLLRGTLGPYDNVQGSALGIKVDNQKWVC